MAIKIPTKDETIKVIASMDSALEADSDAYEKYLETLDESHLKFVEGEAPTRFLMRKVLPFKLSQRVQNQQVEIVDGKAKILPAFMSEEVRCALVGIENPPSLPLAEQIKFEKDSDGGASEKLMESLVAAGIVFDLYKARAYSISGMSESLKKK